ncbi:MarC family protein, partial [Nitrosomonas sp.]|uniref:MarC family protein n=1 Tax=Nitrosomonas sp. TaxID=42353 RepID=UPI0025ED4AA2
RAMTAFERLMGLILTAMSVEMLLAGIRDYLKTLNCLLKDAINKAYLDSLPSNSQRFMGT